MVSAPPYYITHAPFLVHVVCHLTKTGTVTAKQFNWNILLIENRPCSGFGMECIIFCCCGRLISLFTVSIGILKSLFLL